MGTNIQRKAKKSKPPSGAALYLIAHCRQAGIPAPKPEHYFAPPRLWRFDLAWPEQLIAIEIHGKVYASRPKFRWDGSFVHVEGGESGRHTRGKGFTEDREKMNEALLLGWRVLEVTTAHVESGQAFAWLERIFGVKENKI